MTKEILILQRIDNGDGTDSVEASYSIYENTDELHQGARAWFQFDTTLTDSEIIDWLVNNDYKQYNEF
jgi:hypothetical protein